MLQTTSLSYVCSQIISCLFDWLKKNNRTESKLDISCFPLERTWWIFFWKRMQMQWLLGSSPNVFTWTLVFRFWSYSRYSVYMHTEKEKPGYSYLWIHIGPYFGWQHLLSGLFIFFLQHKAHQLVKSREKWDHWGFIACLALWNGNSYVTDMPYRSSGAESISWN